MAKCVHVVCEHQEECMYEHDPHGSDAQAAYERKSGLNKAAVPQVSTEDIVVADELLEALCAVVTQLVSEHPRAFSKFEVWEERSLIEKFLNLRR